MAKDVFDEYSEVKNTSLASDDSGYDEFNDSVDRGKEVKCESCGGNMVFDPETQMLKCDYCGATLDFEKDKKVSENNIEKAFSTAKKWDNAVVVRCENCGAKVVIESDEVAKECPYCGTSQIKRTDEIVGLKPTAVYPFMIKADDAEAIAKKWAKKKLYAPIKFKKEIEAKNFHGVFEPGFTFDSNTFSSYSGVLGKTKTRTVGSGKNRRVETYVQWFHVSGTYTTFFDDVTISASNETAQKQFNKLMPFNKDTIRVYEKRFLAGYQANHYTKDIHVCWGEAKGVMDARIRELIIGQYDCDHVQSLNVSTTHKDVTYKYVLFPMYRFNYTFKNKKYDIAVNGSTGKVVGKTPVSVWKVLITIGIAIAIAAGLYILYRLGAPQ